MSVAIIYDYDDDVFEMFFLLRVWAFVSFFSLPDGFRKRSLDLILLAISFCMVDMGCV